MRTIIVIIGFIFFLVGSLALVGSDLWDRVSQDASARGYTPKEGQELIGTKAPEWTGIEWLQQGPLSLSDLKGKVVLLRFWLAGCPYCTRSAPALKEFWDKYKDKGLMVVALHHPKSKHTSQRDVILSAAKTLKMDYPIGNDSQWQSIHAYGVGTHFKNFTSVSFLIDKDGIIRFVHDGGEFHQGGGPEHENCNAAHSALDKLIQDLL